MTLKRDVNYVFQRQQLHHIKRVFGIPFNTVPVKKCE